MSAPNDIYHRLDLQDTHVQAAAVTANSAFALAGKTDRDIANLQVTLRAHTNSLEALRDTQVEHGKELAEHTRLLAKQDMKLAEHDKRFDNIESLLDRMNKRFDTVDARFDRLEELIKRSGRTA